MKTCEDFGRPHRYSEFECVGCGTTVCFNCFPYNEETGMYVCPHCGRGERSFHNLKKRKSMRGLQSDRDLRIEGLIELTGRLTPQTVRLWDLIYRKTGVDCLSEAVKEFCKIYHIPQEVVDKHADGGVISTEFQSLYHAIEAGE